MRTPPKIYMISSADYDHSQHDDEEQSSNPKIYAYEARS
jgi:hypothetical protein